MYCTIYHEKYIIYAIQITRPLAYTYCEHSILDPYVGDYDRERAIEAFEYFIEYSKSTFHTLRNIKWQRWEINNRPIQSFNDGHSCAAYIMHYMECIGSNIPFDMKFDPYKFRPIVAKRLLLFSENMENSCLHCFSEIVKSGMKCTACSRKVHFQCEKYSNVLTDKEDALDAASNADNKLQTTQRKLKRKETETETSERKEKVRKLDCQVIEGSNSQKKKTFICKLCKKI